MDFSKLTRGQQIALVAGVVLIINLFLPWYDVLGISFNAFDAGFLAWAGSILAIAAAILIAVKVFAGNAVSLGNLQTEQIALVLAGLGTLFIVLKWIADNDFVSFGLFLGLLAAAAVTAGSFMAMREAGLELPDMDDFKSVAGGGDDEGGS